MLRVISIALAAITASCGGSDTFRMSSDDNNPDALAAALSRVQAPAAGKPMNALGKPLAFLVARGQGKSLIAYDLQAKAELWRVPADVTSKVVVGRDFVAHVEGKTTLVGRDLASGKKLWSRPVDGELVGATADAQNVYYTVKESSSKWVLTALGGTGGNELWTAGAPGLLGTPAARGGLVFSPFLKQWLTVLDAKTGKPLTRILGKDEEITFVRASSTDVYFGSKAGVFLMDERAASGKIEQSTYGRAELPKDFVRVHYFWDAFDPIQAGYSAYDRNRILWRGTPAGENLGFKDNRVIVHHFRFFFGFDAGSGQLAWAYSHPRVDVVASTHAGSTVAFASLLGGLGALDPATGRRVYEAKVKGQLIGATFDVEGWAPSDSVGQAQGTAAALAAIARDRDARFKDVKRFAVTALSTLSGGEVTRDLLALIQSEKTPPYLYETAVEVLVARKDPEGLPHLIKALEVHHDFIAGTKPRGVGVVAKAIAALAGEEIDAAMRGSAVEGLLAHLSAPQTPAEDLAPIIKALAAVGGGGEIPHLRSFLLTYRADPAFSTQASPMIAAIDALLANGGTPEYELVAYVASDARTQESVAEYATEALAQLEKKTGEPSGGDAEAAAQ